jgi:hypothetical protein
MDMTGLIFGYILKDMKLELRWMRETMEKRSQLDSGNIAIQTSQNLRKHTKVDFLEIESKILNPIANG